MQIPQPLKSGSKAPNLTFKEYGKEMHTEQIKSPYLVYFYPKDDTPGCTKQACGIRDNWSKFKSAGLRVIGISKDSEESHEKFRRKFALPFSLIADTDLRLAQAFGVFGKKQFMGKTYNAVHRMSFLVDAEGTIIKTYLKVKSGEHAETVLKDFVQLKS
ncbi:MAG: thioredoxin-dependent thiol peroxidase [Verrucomicrobiota bacterium]